RPIIGADSKILSSRNLTRTDVGAYSVSVKNRAGVVSSSAVDLKVLLPPVIRPIAPKIVSVGETVEFEALSAGSGPLSYSWSLNGAPIASETQSRIRITNAQAKDAGLYAVTVQNAAGQSTVSADLTVINPVVITQ